MCALNAVISQEVVTGAAFAHRKHVCEHLSRWTNEKVDPLPDACRLPVRLPCRQRLSLNPKLWDSMACLILSPGHAWHWQKHDVPQSAAICALNMRVPDGATAKCPESGAHSGVSHGGMPSCLVS